MVSLAICHDSHLPLHVCTSHPRIIVLLAVMETMWVRTGKEEWLNATKFWMKLFAINFAIGIATGLILEFQFGSNWSNYSWFVGDIFGAPLAIEGLFAFFWKQPSLPSCSSAGIKSVKIPSGVDLDGISRFQYFRLMDIGCQCLDANPVGTEFNPLSARNEMADFWAVLFSPTAMNKFSIRSHQPTPFRLALLSA